MADVLNETQVAQFQDAFKAVDTDHDGFIASSQLGLVLRSIGQNPTDAEVQVSFVYLCYLLISIKRIFYVQHLWCILLIYIVIFRI